MATGQVSVEHLVLVGLALGLLVPAIYFFFSYNQGSQLAMTAERINVIGNEMVSTVKETFALGSNARESLVVNMPKEVSRVYVLEKRELVFVYETQHGPVEAIFHSPINMTTTIDDGNISHMHAGLTRYQFRSTGSNVSITERVS